jgi:hypothetical protein
MNHAPRSAYGKALALAKQADERPLDLGDNAKLVLHSDCPLPSGLRRKVAAG